MGVTSSSKFLLNPDSLLSHISVKHIINEIRHASKNPFSAVDSRPSGKPETKTITFQIPAILDLKPGSPELWQ